jgi:hypothetical protein
MSMYLRKQEWLGRYLPKGISEVSRDRGIGGRSRSSIVVSPKGVCRSFLLPKMLDSLLCLPVRVRCVCIPYSVRSCLRYSTYLGAVPYTLHPRFLLPTFKLLLHSSSASTLPSTAASSCSSNSSASASSLLRRSLAAASLPAPERHAGAPSGRRRSTWLQPFCSVRAGLLQRSGNVDAG